jgi:hypothetical protein
MPRAKKVPLNINGDDGNEFLIIPGWQRAALIA